MIIEICELCEHYEGLRLMGSAGAFSHYCRAFEERMYTPIKAIKICPKKRKMKYKMELTEEQYQHIIECVETVHRIACGQIDSLREILPIAPDDELLRKIKEQSFPELGWNESYKWYGGYRNDAHGENFRKAFDLFQARGYQIYRQMKYVRDIAKGIDDVLSSPTLTTDKAEQPIIEAVEE